MTERARIAHLLRRAGLGASEAELDYYERLGYRGAVDALMSYDKVPEDYSGLLAQIRADAPQLRMPHVKTWWVARLLSTRRPLQERMVLFWHNHFATSASKVNRAELMMAQNETFRRLALGSFREILLAVSRDPAMLLWLDNHLNRKGKPNENFARELLELFTLGIGNYTEQDVQEAARAFTGWTLRPQVGFQFVPALHDDGEKQFLAQRGNLNGTDIIDILVRHPKTAELLCAKLFRFFAYEQPEPAVLRALMRTYFDSGYQVGAVVRQILLSEAFISPKAVRTMVKSPVDYVIGTLRCVGLAHQVTRAMQAQVMPRAVIALLRGADIAMQRMGMSLFYPPSVKGWDWGKAWITSATMTERLRFAIIQGVGYPNPNRSHFRSMEIWQTATPDSAQGTGWLGRYLDTVPDSGRNPIIGLVLGREMPVAMVGNRVRVPCVGSLDDFRSLIGEDAESLRAVYTLRDERLRPVGKEALAALDLAQMVAAKMNQYHSPIPYPKTPLAQALQQIAQLIASNLNTRVYYCSTGGFDTHAQQAQRHASLLQGVSEGLTAFWNDVEAMGKADRVLVLVFSEFGRRVAENGSQGTDHGAAAPVFVVGKGLQSGIISEHPSLRDLQDGDLRHHIDFRSVYAAVLEDWLGVDSQPLLRGRFKPVPLLAVTPPRTTLRYTTSLLKSPMAR